MRFLMEDLTVDDILRTCNSFNKNEYYKINLLEFFKQCKLQQDAKPFPFLTQICALCVDTRKHYEYFSSEFKLIDSAISKNRDYDFYLSYQDVQDDIAIKISQEEAENDISTKIINTFNNKTPIKLILKDGTQFIGKGTITISRSGQEILFDVKNFKHKNVFSGNDFNTVVDFQVLTEEEYNQLPSVISTNQNKKDILTKNFSFIKDCTHQDNGEPSVFTYPLIDLDVTDYEEVVKRCGYSGKCVHSGSPQTREEPAELPEFEIPYDQSEIEYGCVEDYFDQFCEVNGISKTNELFRQIYKQTDFPKMYLDYWGMKTELPDVDKLYDYYLEKVFGDNNY